MLFPLARKVIMNIIHSHEVKKLVIEVLKHLAFYTDNHVDDILVHELENALFP